MPEHSQDLKQQLRLWAESYGGEQYGRLGYASTEQLRGVGTPVAASAQDKAAVPAIARAIEDIVREMEAQGRWKEARVLRAEAFMDGLPESDRLRRLERSGLKIGRSAYYTYLNSALGVVRFTLARESRG